MVLSILYFHTNAVTFVVLIIGVYTLPSKVEHSPWCERYTTNMQQIKFNYSLKNIGLPTKDNYLRNLMKTESIVRCMQWKAHFFLLNNGDDNQTPNNTYGLKSKHGTPPVLNLKPFEDDVAKMIELAKFQHNFIQTLEQDKRKINASSNVFIPADKTRNFYEMDTSTYNKLPTENVMKT